MAGDQLHRQNIHSLMRTEFKNRFDVRVIQFGQGEGFFAKPFAGILVTKRIGGKNFQRNIAIELFIVRSVHNAHPARTDFRDDAVMTECLADHEW